MFVTCLDLEGVLFPEIWINVALKTGIEELKLTTRDISDYSELMRYRLKIIDQHRLTLKSIQDTIDTMEPLPGAVDFLDWMRRQCQVIIVSDTFEEFAKPVMEMLNMPTIFCHWLGVDEAGIIRSYHLRTRNAKTKAVAALKLQNFETIAVGDSFNDLGMLEEADHGLFFKPPAEIAGRYPHIPVNEDHEALKTRISRIISG